ncbi:Protein of unknown function (DUF3231) [Desulfosporosinus acidiphilus SJ4]|uniref:DUF3231 family protein n=1 Tax=Desulfosporosinus acidiphilus (strain DSM 22704 / JCM 16185 / SJ4) TaxID=646529 RepID=I4D2D2_DESAJ|nr:DUF3231 family protein [Desulfosporosinus acidiphilus]AFM39956.1 Protein of unknown function (DUF3231) [Desulfosporosinus acidiphilus SJ4]
MHAEISKEALTANEIYAIWSAFMKNSMEIRFLEYFLETTEDLYIRKIIQKMLNHRRKGIEYIANILVQENITVPLGLTDDDVCTEAPKIFSDNFILFFCYDLVLFSISVFSNALIDCVRNDVRKYFQTSLEHNIEMQYIILEVKISKGVHLSFPKVAIDNEIDLVDKMNFLKGIFGDSRPINVGEIANLSKIIDRAQFSKMVFVAFSKISKTHHISQHFNKGRDEIQRVLDVLTHILDEENIPMSSSSEYQISDIETSPFSDKLMLFFVNMCLGMFCFTMITQALTSCLRNDLILKISKISSDLKFYYLDSVKLSIKEGWLERPPQSINR